MKCPTCGKPMLRTASGYCCEKWGCSRIQPPRKGEEYKPNTFRVEHGGECPKCKGKCGFASGFYGWEDCPECDGTGIYTDPSRI